jgi:non-ribosomal peptide synthetase component E (peptide arylation enzyme)
MRIRDPPIDPARIARFVEEGSWVETTSNDVLERRASHTPDKLAIVDARVRLWYREYYRRAERLAAHFAALGLGVDDVVAIQLPNWSEFAVAVNATMLTGIPFCQFHSDFRSREVEFILSFTGASALIMPSRFRRFDYLAMPTKLRPRLPAYTRSWDNTTNCAVRFVNEGDRVDSNSVLLAFLPVGLNRGLLNVLQALFAGCTIVLQQVFDAEQALALIERERVTHFCRAPAHLVSLLNAPDLGSYDLSSLAVICQLGLQFFPDPARGLHRNCRP